MWLVYGSKFGELQACWLVFRPYPGSFRPVCGWTRFMDVMVARTNQKTRMTASWEGLAGTTAVISITSPCVG